MGILVVALLAIVFDLLSIALPSLAWMAIPGFVMGLSAWVFGRKLRLHSPSDKKATATMVIGIGATILGIACIFFSFLLGTILGGVTGLGSY